MRILLLNSYFMLMCGCAAPPYLFLKNNENTSDCMSQHIPEFSTVLYNAQINVTGKHLSGLLLFKTMPDQSVRCVFTSETGVTFFDFEFTETGFRVVFCTEKLNKRPVIRQLKKDIGLLLRHEMKSNPNLTKAGEGELYFGYQCKKETNWYITGKDCDEIKRIENASKRKKKIIITLSGYNTGLPDTAYIEHQLFEFNISLQKIER